MPSIEGGIAALIAKYGFIKLLTLGAALAGAGMMAIFRPPRTKKEMGLQAIVALGCSFLFGDTIATAVNNWIHLVNMDVWSASTAQFYVTMHGLVGALSWGLFGGLAHMRDKVAKDPIQAVKDVKDLV